MGWRPLPLSYAVAIYPFQPSSAPTELPLQIGDQLYVIEEGGHQGTWLRGYLVAPPTLTSALAQGARAPAEARVFSGIFPKSCIEIREQLGTDAPVAVPDGQVKPPAPVPMLKIGDESPTSSREPLVDEISSCLREWYVGHLPNLVLERRYDQLERLSHITARLDYARRQLLNDVLTSQERRQVREDAVWHMIRGNKMLSGEVIVRDPRQLGRLLTGQDSAIDMTKLQATMSVLDEMPADTAKAKSPSLQHCLLEVRTVIGSDLDTTTLSLELYERDPDGHVYPFSETYSAAASEKIKTLFADLGSRQVGTQAGLFLAVKVVAPELPRRAQQRPLERQLSRNGSLLGQRQLSLTRRRSSLLFGKRRNAERPTPGQNGRATPQPRDRDRDQAPSPSIPQGEDDGSSRPQGPPVPRTVGVGLLDLDAIIADGQPCDADITIWAASPQDEAAQDQQDPRLLQLLSSPGKRLVVAGLVSSVQVVLTPLTAPDADTLIKNNPRTMGAVAKTQRMSFSEAPSKPRSDIYLRLNRAVIGPGALLSHPEVGMVQVKAHSLRNLQLTMEVRDAAGRRVEYCIYPSSNGAGLTAFRTNAVELDALWDQTLCLRVPNEKVPESHLVLSIADAPEFPFALAWMPLWDKQAFIRDGKHSLILHAYDKITSGTVQGRGGAYQSLPWNHAGYRTVHDGIIADIAALEVDTLLCSTEFSQNQTLVSLINWKHQTSVQLLDILQKVTFVPEIEIVKQVREVLDSLFGVLVHKSGESKFEDLIFNDIVWVLGIVHDRRYNLGPVLDRYTENHFRSPYAASCLIRSFTRLLQSVSDPQSARDMRALFKVGSNFMKIVIASYQQRRFGSQTKNNDVQHSTFKEDMQAILFGLQMMMRSETAALVGSKTLLVQKFHTWLPELLPAFSRAEVMQLAIAFVDASEDARGKLVLHRLLLILQYTKQDAIWADDDDRAVLVQNCVRWLEPYWTRSAKAADWHDQLRLCCSVVAQLTRFPTPGLLEFMPKLVVAYVSIANEPPAKRRSFSSLFQDAYPFVTQPAKTNDHFNETLLELSALIAAMAKMEPSSSLNLQGTELTEYVITALAVLHSLLQQSACPSTWLSLHIYHHSSALAILEHLYALLVASYLPTPEHADQFDMQLWKAYLETLATLVSSSGLTLELFPEQKRRAVWKIAGDVRQAGADLLRQSWESLGWEATADDQRRYNIRRLGGYQVQYVPSLVAPIIKLCLSMHEGLRKVAVEVLQTMIVSEWALSEDLELIETEVIGALNANLKAKTLTVTEALSRKIFIAELLELFSTIANQPDDTLWTALEELVATIDELVDLLTSTDADEGRALTRLSQNVPATAHNGFKDTDSQTSEAKELARARRSIDGLSPSPQHQGRSREYGVHALECYKELADEYERSGDYKRLAKTHRAIARIHEARAMNQLGSLEREVNGRGAADDPDLDEDE